MERQSSKIQIAFWAIVIVSFIVGTATTGGNVFSGILAGVSNGVLFYILVRVVFYVIKRQRARK